MLLVELQDAFVEPTLNYITVTVRVHYQIISTIENGTPNQSISTSWPMICLYVMKKLQFLYVMWNSKSTEHSDQGKVPGSIVHETSRFKISERCIEHVTDI